MRASLIFGFLIACGGGTSATVDSSVSHDGAGSGSGSGSATNQVNGQFGGHTFDAKDAIWNRFDHTNGFEFVGSAAFVEITDYAGACALAGQDKAPTGSLILDLGVAVTDGSAMASVPTAAGVFTVHSSASSLPASSNVAQVYLGSGCSKDVEYEGVSGSVTIATVHADGSYAGTFDIMVSCASFGSCTGGDAHLTGSFTSAACASLDVNTIPGCS
jgi:hypothetical protein